MKNSALLFLTLAVNSFLCGEECAQRIKKFLGDTNTNNIHFEPLEGGFTRAQIYAFVQGDQKYVLRFLATTQSKKFRDNEILAHTAAGALGIAPPCIFADENAEFLIMPFVEGRWLSREDLQDDPFLDSLAHTIQRLHQFTGPYPTKHNLKERIQIQHRKAVESDIAYPTGFAKHLDELQNPETLAPCHGDLHRGNILVSEEGISIIDWTNASWEDPYTDLGYICLLTNLTRAQEDKFLSAYFGRAPVNKEWERLEKAKQNIYLLTATIWFRFGENPEDQERPLQERIDALDAQLHSPTLRCAQEYLQTGEVVHIKTDPKEEVRQYALSFYKAFLNHSVYTAAARSSKTFTN